jgi:hypothetical protein
MTKYIIHLKQKLSPYKTKRIELLAIDSPTASQIVVEKYPNWDVSMFWSDWKPSLKN